MDKKLLALIDGDEIVYKAGYASQTVLYHIKNSNGEILTSHKTKELAIEALGDSTEKDLSLEREIIPKGEKVARMALYGVMNTILADIQPTDYRIYLTGENNFRFDIATLLPYKGHRDDTERPVYYEFIKHILKNQYHAITVDGIEADDAMSITQWHHERNQTGWTTIIASQDKDLKMVPGEHYNPSKREKFNMSKIDARFSFYCQLLSGDSTDNIPGIYRIGEATARKILSSKKDKSNDDLYSAVLKEYIKAQQNEKIREKMPGIKFGEDRIKEVGRLLWMLQEKYQLWVPGEDYYGI